MRDALAVCGALDGLVAHALRTHGGEADLSPRLTRSGYDLRSLVEQFAAKPAEISRLFRGDLDPSRAPELIDAMRAAGLPT